MMKNRFDRPCGLPARVGTSTIEDNEERWLDVDALDYFAGPQAAGADVYSLRSTVDQGANSLDVRVPTTLGADMAVADAHAKRRLLAADFTNACHVKTPREAGSPAG